MVLSMVKDPSERGIIFIAEFRIVPAHAIGQTEIANLGRSLHKKDRPISSSFHNYLNTIDRSASNLTRINRRIVNVIREVPP